jgi:hypothetical protein
MNGLTAYSDIVQIKNNVNSKCQSSPWNTLSGVKSDSDSDSEKHWLNIVGDSYTRACASNIQDILNKNFNVTGSIKSSSNTCTLTDSAEKTIGNLTNNHVLVFWGYKWHSKE